MGRPCASVNIVCAFTNLVAQESEHMQKVLMHITYVSAFSVYKEIIFIFNYLNVQYTNNMQFVSVPLSVISENLVCNHF